MMKSTINIILFTWLAMCLLVPVVNAADDQPETSMVNSYTTDSHIKITEDTDSNAQVDPAKPTDLATPADPNDEQPQAGMPGPLSIDYVSALNFGLQATSASEQQYPAYATMIATNDGTTKYVPPYVQVTDKRALKSGWQLKVSQSAWTNDANELAGAELQLGTGGELTNNLDTQYDTGEYAPMSSNDIVSIPADDSQQVIMSATAGKGFGTWVKTFGTLASTSAVFPTVANDFTNMPLTTDGVQLNMPAGNGAVGGSTYATTLTWTLEDTPQ